MAAKELIKKWTFLQSLSQRCNFQPCVNARRLSTLQRTPPPCATTHTSPLLSPTCRKYGSIYEPEYLDAGGVEIPMYDVLNIQIKGYDFPVLEKYARYVHKTADRVGITVEEAWATPCKKFRVTKLKPESSVIDSEYPLNLYERNVQLSDVPVTLLPILINVVEAALPAGVTLRVHPHLQEYTDYRYVPDLELKQLQSQLEDMRGDKK